MQSLSMKERLQKDTGTCRKMLTSILLWKPMQKMDGINPTFLYTLRDPLDVYENNLCSTHPLPAVSITLTE